MMNFIHCVNEYILSSTQVDWRVDLHVYNAHSSHVGKYRSAISRVLWNYIFFGLQPFYLLYNLRLLKLLQPYNGPAQRPVLLHCAAEVFIIWNSLPVDVHSSILLGSFRSKLKLYLFSKAYSPYLTFIWSLVISFLITVFGCCRKSLLIYGN